MTWGLRDARLGRQGRRAGGDERKAGCEFVGFGVESGNQEILKQTKKGITLEQVRKAFDLARKLKISTEKPYWILGFPAKRWTPSKRRSSFSLDLHSNSKFPATPPLPCPMSAPTSPDRDEKQRGKQGTWAEVEQMIGRVSNRHAFRRPQRGPFYRKVKHLFYKKKYGPWYYFNPASTSTTCF